MTEMGEPARRDQSHLVILLGALLVALALRLLIAGRAIWFDERFTMLNTGSVRDALAYCIKDVHPPLYFILAALWRIVLPSTEFSLRLLSVVFGMASIVGIFLTARAIAGWRAGIAGILIAGLSPYHWVYSTELRPYAMLLAFSAFSAWAFLGILKTGKVRYYIIFAAASALNLYSHYFSVFLLAVQAIVFVTVAIRNSATGAWTRHALKRNILLGVMALCLVAIAYAPWAGHMRRIVTETVVEGDTVGIGRRIGRGVTLDLLGDSLYKSFGWGVVPVCIQAALLACALAVRRLREASGFVVALWAVPFLLLAIWKPTHFIDAKYFLFTYPATVALVAGGIDTAVGWLAARGLRPAVIWPALVLAASASPLLPGQHPAFAFQRKDWRTVAAEVDTTLKPGDRICFLGNSKTYAMVQTYAAKDFFTRHPLILRWEDGQAEAPGVAPANEIGGAARQAASPDSGRGLWILYSGRRFDQYSAGLTGDIRRVKTWNIYPGPVDLYYWVPTPP